LFWLILFSLVFGAGPVIGVAVLLREKSAALDAHNNYKRSFEFASGPQSQVNAPSGSKLQGQPDCVPGRTVG